jgi:prevent-host-death family protein
MAKQSSARKVPKVADTATVSAREAQRSLGDLLSRVGFGNERITITRHGKRIAVLLGAQDLDALAGAA